MNAIAPVPVKRCLLVLSSILAVAGQNSSERSAWKSCTMISR